ncbi:DUF4149 domain-containing protein [Aquifex aeolicus]|uniref:Uncharacterized protein aq_125 n=1 Tax=Aquifex aeolicus (strain VF5) TaxID=224324 RepID=Y125_AQUAE|nr:DUF4149 domain-containing protein [Aquifex aeolicus]O66525.1 RecName: Full=Uncharacterized protein aq_125 [Aquifex aeolicus VF5]AAC06497.1 putative protein [Aquifex aeolicus VF5]
MKEKLALALLSFFLGLGSFFSFYVAPTLFKVLERQQAGAVVEKVFPVYFGLGIILVGISLFLGRDSGKLFLSLGILNLLLLLLQEFIVIPKLHGLKATNYELFLKYHGVSMGINLAILLLTLGKVLILIFKR